MLNRVTIGPTPQVLFAASLITALRLNLQPVQRNSDTNEKNCVVPVIVHGNRYISLTDCHGYLAAGSHNTFSLVHFSYESLGFFE